jgi:two-component system, cell cycle sensor histidine kinase and response regulator CckA
MSMSEQKIRALLVEDNPGDARLAKEVLRDASDIDLHTVDRLSLAVDHLASQDYDIVLLDLGLPDSQGLGSLQAVYKAVPGVPIVVLSGQDDETLAKAAIRQGAQDYLTKSALQGSAVVRTLRFAVERKQTEIALRKSEAKYRRLHESLMDGFVQVDLQGHIIEWNSIYQTMLGYTEDELRSLSYVELTPEKWHAFEAKIVSDQIFTRGYSEVYEKEYRRKDGSVFPVELRTSLLRDEAGVATGMWAIVRDLTEHKLLQRQYFQSQKMEEIGRLATGVAHDFNNLLTIIIGYSEQLLNNSSPGDSTRSELEQIRAAGERAADLTSKLLAYSRKQIIQPRVLDLNSFIKDNSKLLRRLVGEDVEIITVPAPDLGRVKADLIQIEQILLNLAVNSRDAMPKGGKIIFKTANVDLDASFVGGNIGSQPGRFVMLAVCDTGTGIDPEAKSHVFEPFFTTKEMGKGTGLGLATVYGIVKQSDGYITVDSEPGQGSTFKVYLPRVDAPVDQIQRLESIASQGSETILLVEDEENVRIFAARFLEVKGYTVLKAVDGPNALRIAEGHSGAIDLLITDMVLPNGLNGRDVAERLQNSRPEISVIFVSGYAAGMTVNTELDPDLRLLQKPFTGESLARMVREVLQQKS